MIVVTGAAGFIGSCLITDLLERGKEIWAVDKFDVPGKQRNLEGKKLARKSERSVFLDELQDAEGIEAIIHIGARTDTTEFDKAIFDELNVEYTKTIWNWCAQHDVPLIYASSAATYGGGELGYDDDHSIVEKLKPLNPYGDSKNEVDIWALGQEQAPPKWYGLKFFNVYGPNEYHKGRMASVVFHTFNQINQKGSMSLFRSHREDYKDGEQERDFIYVKDIVKVILFLLEEQPQSGLYNLGTGKARTFNDLAAATFRALDLEPKISYIDTPEDIRDKYQYYTEANMSKLLEAGYKGGFHSLEEGVEDYVKNYLSKDRTY